MIQRLKKEMNGNLPYPIAKQKANVSVHPDLAESSPLTLSVETRLW